MNQNQGAVSHIFGALRFSWAGLCTAFRQEVAFRQDVLLGVVNMALAIFLPIELLARLFMIAIWVVLISVELLNTAIEAVVDLVSPQRQEKARIAKDVASAAVFSVLVLWMTCWVVLIVRCACR